MTLRRGPAALLAALALTACASHEDDGAASGPRLVVLYATCTLQKGFTAPYDASVAYTPNLARFAADAVVFEHCYTEAGQSGPGYAALFSGTHADRHGVYHHPTRLRDDLYLAAEAFAGAGYDTYFWNGHRMGSIELGYGQGVPAANAFARRPPDKAMLTGRDPRFLAILERLQRDPDYRAFVQINFTLTHGPYHRYSPAPMTERFCKRYPEVCAGVGRDAIEHALPLYEKDRHQLQWNLPETRERLGLDDADVDQLADVLALLYASCVAQFDRYFGEWTERIDEHGLTDDTLFAFTADHGEILYRDNALFHWAHGGQLVPEVLEVPLLLRWPAGGVSGGRRVDAVTRSVDVFPTLAGLAGITLPQGLGLDGVDLSGVARGTARAPELTAFFRTTTLSPAQLEESRAWTLLHSFYPRTDPALMWVGARRGERMYALRDHGTGTFGLEVFDLEADPEQRHDLADPSDERQIELTMLLEDYRERLIAGFDATPVSAVSRDEEEELLRALGYIR